MQQRDFDVFSIEELNNQLRTQQNQELIKKVHDLFFDIKEQVDDEDYFFLQCEEQGDEKLQPDYNIVLENSKRNCNSYLKLIPQDDLQLAQNYNDKYPLLQLRKQLFIYQQLVSKSAQQIVINPIFEIATIVIIVFNSIMLAMDDPTTAQQSKFADLMDQIFLGYYSLEALLKIIANGLILPKKAYLREIWNLLDFSVIITAFLPYIITSNQLNLNSLRSFRVLRPLRTISSIKSLRMILLALFSSLSQLRDAAIILVFFYTIFAIAGVQLFSGYLKRRCFSENLGITLLVEQEIKALCALDFDCPSNFICGKQIANPQSDLINFDTFGWAFLQVFIITTLEGWSSIQEYVMTSFSQFVVFYFLLVVIVGAFFLVNLTLAVIKLNFRPERIEEDLKLISEEQECYDYWELRNLDLYKPKRYTVATSSYGASMEITNLSNPQIKRKANKYHTIVPYFKGNLDETIEGRKKIRFKQIKIANDFSKPVFLFNKIRLEGIQGMVNQDKLRKQEQLIAEGNLSQPDINQSSDLNFSSSNNKIEKLSKKGTRKTKNSQTSKVSIENNCQNNQLELPEITRRTDKEKSIQIEQNEREALPYSQTMKAIHLNQLPESLSVTEFGSIHLSELSESELENRLDDMDIDIKQASGTKAKILKNGNALQQQKTIKKTDGKRFKDYLQSEMAKNHDRGLDETHLKLKSKLVNTQFYTIVKITDEHFPSVNDVLESKLLKDLFQQKLQQEHKIKTMPLKVQYCFKNSKPILNYQSKGDENQLKKPLNTQTNKKKVYHGIRRIKPILDDIHPIEEFLMLSQLMEEETRRGDDANIDVQNSQDQCYESQEQTRRKKKSQNDKQIEYNYSELQQNFQENTDTIINMNNAEALIKDIDLNQQNVFLSYHEREVQKSIFYHEYYDIKKMDAMSNGYIKAVSSIEDVLYITGFSQFDRNFATSMNNVMNSLNYNERAYFMWIKGIYGILLISQHHLYYIVYSNYFETLMNLAVTFNTVILALDGLVSDNSSSLLIKFNFGFTLLFTIELALKIIAQGIVQYLKDTLNVFDSMIVCLSLIELFILGEGSNSKSSLSAFRSVRIFRVFRVLRVTKLMKSLRFMGFLVKVLASSFQSLMYILFLMVIFIFIFTLLGMSFFGGQLTYTPSRQNFDNIQSSFLIVFQVLTLENWNSLLYELLLQPISPAITIAYLVFWIMIGNYVFLNLFLAILLENFEEEYRNDKSDPDSDIYIAKNISTVQALPSQNIISQSNTNINFITQTLSSTQAILKRKSLVKVQFQENDIILERKTQQFDYFIELGICQYSIYLFSQQNWFRRLCYRIVKDSKFEGIILVLICLTTIKLIFDTYIPNQGEIKVISLQLDIYFAVLFGIECGMKIIAFGFVQEEAAYLRESWNVLDFFIVIASFVDVSVSTINLSFVKILRLLRTLRPLRFITHNKSMKILVSALLSSINGIFNVGIVIILAWLMFAILGVSLMKNKLHFCNLNDGKTYYYGKQQCIDIHHGIWDNRQINFDNILNGMLTLFILSTLEGWPDYFYYFVDADESGPIFNAQLQFSWYFVIFILFGAMLLINLFIGVILVNYHLAEEASRDQILTQAQSDWIELQKRIVLSNPNMALFFPPGNRLRAMIFKIIKWNYFDPFIMSIIVVNIVTMGLSKEEASPQYDMVLQNLNTSFTFIFIGEAILKIIALGPIGYMRNGWNQFDFFVVCASILDLILNFLGSSFITFLKVGPQIARVFRVLRVTRLFRLVKQFQGLQKLIETALYSLPAMLNATALLFLVFFIFSILGVFLFQDINTGQIISDLANFSDFHHSFQLLFQCSTGENWYLIMFDTMAAGSYYNCIFFIIFILIQQYIMLNLFILIILDQYEINYFNSSNPLNKFQEFENIFVESWSKFAFHDKGMQMHNNQLVKFMFAMEEPLGYELTKQLEEGTVEWKNANPDISKENIEKFQQQLLVNLKKQVCTSIMKMNVYSDHNGFVRYHQMLFAVLKNYLWDKLNINLTEEGAKRISLKEEETKIKISSLNIGKVVLNDNLVNPIVQYLFVSMTFKAMKRYKLKRKAQQDRMAQLSVLGQEFYSDGNSSNTSYDLHQEIFKRSSKGSLSDQEEPDYGQIKYSQIPNNGLYQNESQLNHTL